MSKILGFETYGIFALGTKPKNKRSEVGTVKVKVLRILGIISMIYHQSADHYLRLPSASIRNRSNSDSACIFDQNTLHFLYYIRMLDGGHSETYKL